MVASSEPGGQAALAQRLGTDRTALTYLLDDLVEAKLVEEHLLAGLDTAERSALRELLSRVATHANDHDPIAHPCDAVRDIAAPE